VSEKIDLGDLDAPRGLVRYESAKRALAELHRVDEVKGFIDKAKAIEVYAKHSKDRQLIEHATKVRKRALRRLGEVIAEQKKAGKLAKGSKGRGRPQKIGGVKNTPPKMEVTLEEQGVDKNLAKEARAAAKLSEEEFEQQSDEAASLAVAAATKDADVITAVRAKKNKGKQEKRKAKEEDLATKIEALPDKRYGVILADPEWKFEFWSEAGKNASSPDNHYPTSALEVIKARDVPSIAADNCVLFLWATAPMLPQALEVMAAWGFTYKTNAAWDKMVAGTGFWFRGRHEHLLLGVKGEVPAPAPGQQAESVIEEMRRGHSVKPEKVYQIIESYFPNVPKIELNAREARPSWDRWGAEAPAAAA
jgi:N6-adenosine-specific RNA methylase IME4